MNIKSERIHLSIAASQFLEKVVDTAVRMGLEVNKLDQAILALVLESVSYKRIAADFDMTQNFPLIVGI